MHDLSGWRLAAFAILLVVVPPAALVAVLAIVHLVSSRAARWVFAGIAGTLTALFAVPALDRAIGIGDAAWAIAMVGVATGATLLFARKPALRTFVRHLSPAPVLFLALFLLVSPASDLIDTTDPVAVAGAGTATTPVVVLVFDEFPLGAIVDDSGGLDRARFPGFARLARLSTWYRNATTISAETHVAVPAIASGRVPEPGTAPIAGAYPRTLFTMLGNAGPVRATEDVVNLCPDSICSGRSTGADPPLLSDLGVVFGHTALPAGLEDRWLPSLDGQWSNFGGEPVVTTPKGASLPDARTYLDAQRRRRAVVGRDDPEGLLERFVDSIRGPSRSALWYGHFHFPHRSYRRLPDGTLYLDRERHPDLNDLWPESDQLAGFQTMRLLLQVGDADRLVDRLLDRLEHEQLLDDALLVVVADHGQSLRDPSDVRGLKAMDAANRDDVLPVPLFVKYPGRAGGVVDRRVAESIDVLPTVVDVLDADLPREWRFDGRSLLDRPDPDRARTPDFFPDSSPAFLRDTSATRSGAWMREQIAAPRGNQRDFYRLAPFGALVGRAIDELGVRDPIPGATARLNSPDAYDDVRAASGWQPALLRAHLAGVDGTHVAVALNGTVAGVGPMFHDRGRFQAAAMLDPTFLRDGPNDVTLYRVSGPPSAPVLEPIPTLAR